MTPDQAVQLFRIILFVAIAIFVVVEALRERD